MNEIKLVYEYTYNPHTYPSGSFHNLSIDMLVCNMYAWTTCATNYLYNTHAYGNIS